MSEIICDYEYPSMCVRLERKSVDMDYEVKEKGCVDGRENASVCPPPPSVDVNRCERAGMAQLVGLLYYRL